MYRILSFCIYLVCFIASFYGLSGIRFDLFVNVKQPVKAHVLLLFLAMGLAYISGQFILAVAGY